MSFIQFNSKPTPSATSSAAPETSKEGKVPSTKSQYSKADMKYLAELYGRYYIAINKINNVLSPNRIQINKEKWKKLTDEYNEYQENRGEFGVKRSPKALQDKFSAMLQVYDQKKASINTTGVGGGPMTGFLEEMHSYLYDDPKYHPKVTYSSLKRSYSVRQDDDEQEDAETEEEKNQNDVLEKGVATLVIDDDESDEELSPVSVSPSPAKKRKSAKKIKEDEKVKATDEALDRMKEITENMTSKLDEILSKPIVHHHVESEDKKNFYKELLEIARQALQ